MWLACGWPTRRLETDQQIKRSLSSRFTLTQQGQKGCKSYVTHWSSRLTDTSEEHKTRKVTVKHSIHLLGPESRSADCPLNAFSLLATGLPKRSGQLVAFHWQDRLRENEYFPLYAEATYLKKKKKLYWSHLFKNKQSQLKEILTWKPGHWCFSNIQSQNQVPYNWAMLPTDSCSFSAQLVICALEHVLCLFQLGDAYPIERKVKMTEEFF